MSDHYDREPGDDPVHRPTSVEDLVLDSAGRRDCRKHDLAEDCDAYAAAKVDEMSNSEFLGHLSEALEKRLRGRA